MTLIYKRARNEAGMPVETARRLLGVSSRTLLRYESGEVDVPADIVQNMSRIYGTSWLTMAHCKQKCAIGRHSCYELLNNVNMDPAYVLLKLKEEIGEAQKSTDKILNLIIGKQGRFNLTDAEFCDLRREFQELLDVEHNIEILKMTLAVWMDVNEEIRRHNDKCYQSGYVVTKEKPLAVAEQRASYSF